MSRYPFVDPLFYLSSFQSQWRAHRRKPVGFSIAGMHRQAIRDYTFLDTGSTYPDSVLFTEAGLIFARSIMQNSNFSLSYCCSGAGVPKGSLVQRELSAKLTEGLSLSNVFTTPPSKIKDF